MKKVLSLGVVTALVLGALTGCSMESSSGSGKKDSKDKKDLTIGVSTITMQHQFYIDIDEGIKEEAEKQGVKVIVNDPDQDVAKDLGGKAQIAIVTELKSHIQRERVEGFKEAFKDSADIKILNSLPGYDREESLNTVENLLQSNPDVDIIYATAENSVLGAKAALESSKNTKAKIVGFDLTEEAASGINDGTVLAMIQQQPKEMGKMAVDAVVKSIRGEKVEKNIPVPVVLYDKTNVKDFK